MIGSFFFLLFFSESRELLRLIIVFIWSHVITSFDLLIYSFSFVLFSAVSHQHMVSMIFDNRFHTIFFFPEISPVIVCSLELSWVRMTQTMSACQTRWATLTCRRTHVATRWSGLWTLAGGGGRVAAICPYFQLRKQRQANYSENSSPCKSKYL